LVIHLLRVGFYVAAWSGIREQGQDGGWSRRLLALAEIHDGRRRSDAARLAGVGLRIVRDRVLRFDAEGPTARRRVPRAS